MIALRTLTKKAAPIYNATVGHFITEKPTPIPNSTPSSAHYDDLIYAAGKKGDFAAVRRLLSKRVSQGCFNTTNTFKFIAIADVSVVDELLQNLADLEDWFTRKHAHDALVAQLAKLHRTDEALRVADIVVTKNYGATARTFTPVINTLARKKDFATAWRVVDAMRAWNVKPDLILFNHILTAYCCVGDVASAADTLVKMEAEGLKADAITYDALVLGACRAGKVEAALAVMRWMVDDGLPPLFSLHAHIIKEMVACGYYAQAVEYVRIFAGRDEKLDKVNFGCLARRLKYAKRVAEAEAVVEEIARRGLAFGDLESICRSL